MRLVELKTKNIKKDKETKNTRGVQKISGIVQMDSDRKYSDWSWSCKGNSTKNGLLLARLTGHWMEMAPTSRFSNKETWNGALSFCSVRLGLMLSFSDSLT